MTEIMLLANAKGGVGKTTTTMMTAWALAHDGCRVLCVDLDVQANLTSILSRTYTLNHDKKLDFNGTIMSGLLNDDLQRTIVNIADNLDLLPTGRDFSQFYDFAFASAPDDLHVRQRILMDSLQPIIKRDTYDYIFFDVPPSESLVLDNAVYNANIFIVCQTSVLSLEGAVNFYQYLSEFAESHQDATFQLSGVIPVMMKQRSINDDYALDEIKDTFSEDMIIGKPLPQQERLKRYAIRGITEINNSQYHDRFDVVTQACYDQLAHQLITRVKEA